MPRERRGVEWPTLALIAGCYAAIAAGALWLPQVSTALAIAVTAAAIALFSSLQHEVIHGHPFRKPRLNAALVFPALSLLIPYLRFRDTHLDHHRTPELTDPYDDPESNYLDPAVWQRLPRAVRGLLAVNNTLLGRVVVGVAISQWAFMAADWRNRRTDPRIVRGWLWHVPALVPVVALVWWAPITGWQYAAAVYAGLSLVKIRTFLEHQAHTRAAGRSVIIEDRGPLALLFLNNNLHAVHHCHPQVPWYRLPGLYTAQRAQFLRRNGGYVYRSYAQIARAHLLRRKDPVPHPHWP